MKELSIEQKAKRYDEALERAKSKMLYPDKPCFVNVKEIFPELKESEDERIRKWCVSHFRECFRVTKDNVEYQEYLNNKVIPWLEKQGEQKPADKIEPKFKIGDWVVNKLGHVWHIDSFDKKNYQVSNGDKYNYFPIFKQDEMHLWTIEDAKDGDILFYENEIFIVKKSVNINILYYCCYDREHFIIDNFYSLTIDDIDNIRPATNGQRDLLFKKMKEAGYEWDAEKKELKKIEQTSAWSEEDKRMFESVLWHLRNSVNNGDTDHSAGQLEIWLKSIRPQSQWKPSDEQLYWIKWVAHRLPDTEKKQMRQRRYLKN